MKTKTIHCNGIIKVNKEKMDYRLKFIIFQSTLIKGNSENVTYTPSPRFWDTVSGRHVLKRKRGPKSNFTPRPYITFGRPCCKVIFLYFSKPVTESKASSYILFGCTQKILLEHNKNLLKRREWQGKERRRKQQGHTAEGK